MRASDEIRGALGDTQRTDAGAGFTVRRVRFGELPDVLDLFSAPIEASLNQSVDLIAWCVSEGLIEPGKPVAITSGTALLLLRRAMPILARMPALLRAAQKFCALVSDRRLEEVQQLELDEAIPLLMRAGEVNQRFFVQRLLPLLRDEWGRASTRWTPQSPTATDAAAGPTSSAG